MTLVKICGITNLDDALAAVDAGAGALGFNFYQKSPRYIEAETARSIVEALPDDVLKVGVFVNVESPEDLRRVARLSGVEMVQLHGDESPEYCDELKDYSIMKALAVGEGFDPNVVTHYDVDAILLDTSDRSLRGGTGRVFDWSIAQRVSQLFPRLFLAGGLTPTNVGEAINIVRPYGVDTCSGVESQPGRKNHQSMRDFVKAVHGVKP